MSPSRVYSAELGRFIQKDPLPKVVARGELGVYENSVFAEEIIAHQEQAERNGYIANAKEFGMLYGFVNNNVIVKTDYLGLISCCEVKSIKLKVVGWSSEFWYWPTLFARKYWKMLTVKFTLKVTDKKDCIITQKMKGKTTTQSPYEDSLHEDWVIDGPSKGWWDGTTWPRQSADGSWSRSGDIDTAKFKDETGFRQLDKTWFPIYWGGANGTGYFKYKTQVRNKSDYKVVKELEWGILIDYSSPKKGKHYFYL